MNDEKLVVMDERDRIIKIVKFNDSNKKKYGFINQKAKMYYKLGYVLLPERRKIQSEYDKAKVRGNE